MVLQKFLEDIKDEDKEHLFAEQFDVVEEDVRMSSRIHDHYDVTSARDEEDFSVSLNNSCRIKTATCHQDYWSKTKVQKN